MRGTKETNSKNKEAKMEHVGAGPVSATISKEKQNKGITLIALIITIIVMLILVAVTITVAVNGGLFEYAGRAGRQTNETTEEEQKLADGQVTIDGAQYNSINEYINGVDLSIINVGDYISNYPVQYTNVATSYDSTTGAEIGHYPSDEFTGWKVLSKETDDNGNKYVRLISAGVPLSYYHPSEYGGAKTSVEKLTTGFLTTEINSSKITKYKFYKCGFNIGERTNLGHVFANNFTDRVQALTREDIVAIGGKAFEDWGSYVNDSKYAGLFAVPCKGNESSQYAWTYLASSYYGVYQLWGINNQGYLENQQLKCLRYTPRNFTKI